MDGATLAVGGVAAVKTCATRSRWPPPCCRKSRSCWSATGPSAFAREHDAEICAPGDLVVERPGDPGCDTVGCVALDRRGNLAAGTSTGGLTGSHPGRVGDSPLPGCGLYADNAVGGVSLSGEGESLIRTTLAARLMHPGGHAPGAAIEAALTHLARVGGEAGLIVIDADGRIDWGHNSAQFAVAHASAGSSRPAPSSAGPRTPRKIFHDRDVRRRPVDHHRRARGQGGRQSHPQGRRRAPEGRPAGPGHDRLPRTPEGYFETYQKAFASLGVTDLVELYIEDRAETHDAEKAGPARRAAGVFFSGGDQLRISSQIGDTPIEARIREIWRGGGVLAGTSAGASVMSDTMMVRGASAETHRIGDLQMAPGLGLVRDVIIDQHFAERGRIGRLLGAVAQSPRVLGSASTRTPPSFWKATPSA
jgi:isoaspartyl peptidase/L-asparaginase-like protein (Ntn-hydrolase superfamily)